MSATNVVVRSQLLLTRTAIAAVLVGCLYFAQPVVVPIALAVFISFVLAIPVKFLQRKGLRRTPSVLIVVIIVAVTLGGFVRLVMIEMTQLARELPTYSGNIKEKVRSLHQMAPGSAVGVINLLHDIGREWDGQSRQSAESTSTPKVDDKPQQVVMQPAGPAWLWQLSSFLHVVLESFISLAFAMVLVFLTLLKPEALRDRLIRLVRGPLTTTTKAIDDAGERISRYLRRQLLVNTACGMAWALGLYVIGVDYAFLWGFFVAALRYVPYFGATLAALMPISLSLAQFPDWWHPLLVAGYILIVEIVCTYAVEPLVYGQSLGVSPVAMLVSAAFWTLLWGPIGLVLSGPVTVCLVVLGKYFPQLEFFEIILGDEQVLEPHVRFYQRLLARDQDEALQLVLAKIKDASPDVVYDEMLVPALNFAKRDRERNDLSDSDEHFIVESIREILDDLREFGATHSSPADSTTSPDMRVKPVSNKVELLAYPARDEEDLVALEMLKQMLDPARWTVEIAALGTLTSELVARVSENTPGLICVAALPPGGVAHARYACKRLRGRFSSARIIVARWASAGDVDTTEEIRSSVAAELVSTSLLETREHLNSWLPVFSKEESRVAVS